jgi:hypothetical protein
LFYYTDEKNAEVGGGVGGVVPGVQLQEGDNHQDQTVGGQPASEHLQQESVSNLHTKSGINILLTKSGINTLSH